MPPLSRGVHVLGSSHALCWSSRDQPVYQNAKGIHFCLIPMHSLFTGQFPMHSLESETFHWQKTLFILFKSDLFALLLSETSWSFPKPPVLNEQDQQYFGSFHLVPSHLELEDFKYNQNSTNTQCLLSKSILSLLIHCIFEGYPILQQEIFGCWH